MHATLGELAALVEGQLFGPPGLTVRGAAPLAEAGPGHITLVDKADKEDALRQSPASAAVVPRCFEPNGLPVIRVEDVHGAFAAILCHFRPPRARQPQGISPLAVVSPSARLAHDVEIHAHVTIGDEVEIGEGATIHAGARIMDGVRIGPQTTVFPNAVIYEDTIVGPRCVIHAGAVIGAYGFGYVTSHGRHRLTAQLGNVVLGPDVEVGACSTIDRGTYGSTVIGEGTKIDNLVMIAHNCRIGRHNVLCSQVGVAGSTTTGDYVVMAGQVGVKDHVQIGERAVLGAMAGVIGDVPAGARMVGIPATPEREQKLKQVAWIKLPEMRREFKQMQATISRLAAEVEALRSSRGANDEDRGRAVA